MAFPSAIPKKQWTNVGTIYKSGLPMRAVAERYNVAIGAVVYVLRQTNVPRRSFSVACGITFESKKPSFFVRKMRSIRSMELNLIGAMLYWAEGYKTAKASGIDFANSDPNMAQLFMFFLKSRYTLDSKRLYCQIYYYADQDIEAITRYWSKKLSLPRTSFRYPYKKDNFKVGGKKLLYGVVHIRYNDKKLLRDVLNLIESYRRKYCVGR